ncbi:MAG: Crp/Fnr family transcriptional regulator [Flavobacteriales bacterium]|nr:Crp/Fnr family transcriptional regulator [Flavobacteriales bacterium]
MREKLQEQYGYLLENELLDEIAEIGTIRTIQAEGHLIDPGQYIKSIPLLMEGVIKVSRLDENADELLLYFIESGDTCAMTLNCCMQGSKSEIKAVAETDATLLMVPLEKMEDWLVKYRSWRNFILNSYQARLHEVLQTVDSIAFLKMDERLLNYLQDKTKIGHSETIHITHEEIAKDLHSSRVVISRLLKKLENDGQVKLHRNSIDVIEL